MRQIFHGFSFPSKARILFDKYKVSKHSSGAIFPLEGDLANPFIVTRCINRDSFSSIKAYAEKHSATVNDIMLTAYIRALHKDLGGHPIAIPCTVDLRKYLPRNRAGCICNLTSTLVCDIGSDIGATFNATLLKVKQAMDSEKHSRTCLNGIMLLELLFGLLPYKKAKELFWKVFINPPIAITNIGIIDKSRLRFDDIDATDVFMTGSIKYKPYFQLALTTFDGRVTFSINFHGAQKDKEKIRRFLLELDNELSTAVSSA